MAVVVLSYRNEDTILHALASLHEQGLPLEIVVSHSGGGPTPALVAEAFADVAVEAAPHRRLPGAARNAGVAATRAEFVAFLAADCTALPGWAAARLAVHRAGATAVGGALQAPQRGPALASHLLQHWSRMPHARPRPYERFSVSYARGTLERHGPFPPELAFAEDAALNARVLAAGEQIAWAPAALIAHHYPATTAGLLRDQVRRHRRRSAIGPRPLHRVALVARALGAAPAGIVQAARRHSVVSPPALRSAIPLVFAGALAGAAGALLPAPREPGAAAELAFRRWAAVSAHRTRAAPPR